MEAIQLPPRNYLITYYQTLDEVTWLLRQEKINNTNILKFEKIANFIKKTSKSRKVKLFKTNPLKLKTMQ